MRGVHVVVLVLLSSSAWAGSAIGESLPLPCEEGTPPSGLYQERYSFRLFEYDCLTGVLVPADTEVARSMCNADRDPTTGGGVCAHVTRIANDTIAWRFQIALISMHDHQVEATIQDEATREVLLTCPDAPNGCRPLRHGVISWLDISGESTIGCANDTRTVFGQIGLTSPSGSIIYRGPRATLC